MYIPNNEIHPKNLICIDEVGEVFEWRGQILRGIRPTAKDLVDYYFTSGFVAEIVEKGLFPKTVVTEHSNENYCMILEHEKIDSCINDSEWCFEMLKDAALLVLQIAQIGRKYGLDMKDCHSKNIMFKNNRAIYVDLGSFVPIEDGASGMRVYWSILRNYVYVLNLWGDGLRDVPKRIMSITYMSDEDYHLYRYPWLRFNGGKFFLSIFETFTSLPTKISLLSIDKARTYNILVRGVKTIIDGFGRFECQKLERLEKRVRAISMRYEVPNIRNPHTMHLPNEVLADLIDKKLMVVNPSEYNMADVLSDCIGGGKILAVDYDEIKGNVNYLHYRSLSKNNIQSAVFYIWEPYLKEVIQDSSTNRFKQDIVIFNDIQQIEKDLGYIPLTYAFKSILRYTFSNLLVVSYGTYNFEDTILKYYNISKSICGNDNFIYYFFEKNNQ